MNPNIKFDYVDNFVDVKFKVFNHDNISCMPSPTGRPYFNLVIKRNKTVKDLEQEFIKDQNQDTKPTTYLVMVIDRETGSIKRILNENTDLPSIVGDRNDIKFNFLPELIRFQQINSEELNLIQKIVIQKNDLN